MKRRKKWFFFLQENISILGALYDLLFLFSSSLFAQQFFALSCMLCTTHGMGENVYNSILCMLYIHFFHFLLFFLFLLLNSIHLEQRMFRNVQTQQKNDFFLFPSTVCMYALCFFYFQIHIFFSFHILKNCRIEWEFKEHVYNRFFFIFIQCSCVRVYTNTRSYIQMFLKQA